MVDIKKMSLEELRECMGVCRSVTLTGMEATLLEGIWPPKYSMCNSRYYPEISKNTYIKHMELYSECQKELTRRWQIKNGYDTTQALPTSSD